MLFALTSIAFVNHRKFVILTAVYKMFHEDKQNGEAEKSHQENKRMSKTVKKRGKNNPD